jgi:hypothetical protein
MSRLCREEALVLEGGGFKAMMVLLLKHMHLQKEVAVDLAAEARCETESRRKRSEDMAVRNRIVVRGSARGASPREKQPCSRE